jgi:hypothetical protein
MRFTTLFDDFGRLFGLAMESERRKISTIEVIEREAAAQVSGRHEGARPP